MNEIHQMNDPASKLPELNHKNYRNSSNNSANSSQNNSQNNLNNKANIKQSTKLPKLAKLNSSTESEQFAHKHTRNSQIPVSLGHRRNPHNVTDLSTMSENSKKILRWHLWWNKQPTDLRIPLYGKQNKDIGSKIDSLKNVTHRPGGGNVSVIDEKLEWRYESKIDAINKDYRPRGGNRMILNEKLSWNKQSKIDSLSNKSWKPPPSSVQILDQRLDLSHVQPAVDSGFIYEQVIVPPDYEVKNTPRYPDVYREHIEHARKGVKSRQSSNFSQ